jgi:hypothetical protein
MKSSRLLAIVVVLQGLILAGQWTSHNAGFTPSAHAAPPVSNALNQSEQTVDELKAVNAKLDQLISLLQSGDLQVRVVTPDEKK